MNTYEDIMRKISSIKVCKSNGKRSPHKPLLILLSLGRYLNDGSTQLDYKEIKDDLTELLQQYGRPIKAQNPQQPFVRLANDGLWKLSRVNTDNKVSSKWLLENNVSGGFSDELLNLISTDEKFINDIIENILTIHFPLTLHEEILEATGLMEAIAKKRITVIRRVLPRDASFRKKVLEIYNYKCAVCGYDIRLGDRIVGLEAAHIQWHEAMGPSTENNGLALCSIHHKLFDQGAFMINDNFELNVSDQIMRSHSADVWLGQYDDKRISLPLDGIYKPNENYMHWHVSEVYRG